jgi:8-amino-7-oxononanoate synthase
MHEVSPSHIIPIIIGDAARAVRLSKALKLRGVLCLPIRVPTVPPGTERLRLSLNASISDRDIQHIAEAFAEVAAMQI